MASRKYECPFCHYRFIADAGRMLESGALSLVRGFTGGVQENPADRSVDLKCPHCSNEFEVTVEG